MKRIVLFLLTNLAVMLVLSIVLTLLGVNRYAGPGMSMGGLLAFAAVVGFTGSIFSLLISKPMAKWTTGARVVNGTEGPQEQWLVASVRRYAEKAGIGMPEVAVYDAPEMNAFATGMSKNSALVAVSSGLLQSMDREQVDAVLGHEITHVANGDMVTMALIQGVLNTFVIFLARVIGTLVDRALSGNRDSGGGFAYFGIVIVLQIALGFLASLIVMAFSRWREFRADAGGARLAGRDSMISALQRLGGDDGQSTLPKAIQAFGITGEGGIARFLRSHPPIPERIAALRALQPT